MRERVELPTYAFDHQHFWVTPTLTTPGLATVDHPLLAGSLHRRAEGGCSPGGGRWGPAVVRRPRGVRRGRGGRGGAGGTGRAVGARVGCPVVEELTLVAPVVLTEDSPTTVQVRVGDAEDGRCTVSVHSRLNDEQDWLQHATGVLGDTAEPVVGEVVWPPEGAVAVPVDGLYGSLAERGFGYGPAFQGLRAAWRLGDDFFAEIAAVMVLGVPGASGDPGCGLPRGPGRHE